MAPKEELALGTLQFLLLEASVEPSAVVGIPRARSRFCRTVCASAPEWVPGQWRPSCPLTEAGREAHGGVPRSLSSLRAGGSQADVLMCRLFRNPTGFILCFGGGHHRGADGRFQRLGRGDWLLGDGFTFLAVCLSCFSELPAVS